MVLVWSCFGFLTQNHSKSSPCGICGFGMALLLLLDQNHAKYIPWCMDLRWFWYCFFNLVSWLKPSQIHILVYGCALVVVWFLPWLLYQSHSKSIPWCMHLVWFLVWFCYGLVYQNHSKSIPCIIDFAWSGYVFWDIHQNHSNSCFVFVVAFLWYCLPRP